MNNEKLNKELYGFDFELRKITYDNESIIGNDIIDVFDDIEEVFKQASQFSIKSVLILKKKNKSLNNSKMITATEYGYDITSEDKKLISFTINELKKEEVS